MKNKKILALVALPLAISLSLGMSGCGSATANSTTTPIIQEQVVNNPAEAKANIISTMKKIQDGLLEKETAEYFVLSSTAYDEFKIPPNKEKEEKLWKAIEPYIAVPTDDASLIQYVFGDTPEKEDTADVAKRIIIGFLAGVFFEDENELKDLDLPKLRSFNYDFTTLKALQNGNVQPLNQVTSVYNTNGTVKDMNIGFYELEFTPDGNKFLLNPATFSNLDPVQLGTTLEEDALELARILEIYMTGKNGKITQDELVNVLKNESKMSRGNTFALGFNEKNRSYKITVQNGELELSYDPINNITPPVREIEEYPTFVLYETMRAVQEIDVASLKAIEEGTYLEMRAKIKDSEQGQKVTDTLAKAKISDDKKILTANIDGLDYTFEINKK